MDGDGDDLARKERRRDLGCVLGSLAGLGVGVVAVLGTIALGLTLVVPSCDFEIGPGDGRDSERLAVTVTPTDDLSDGTVVGVESDAFAPHRIVGVAVCLSEAATVPSGVEDCDTDGGQRFAVDPEGHLTAVVAVPRVITVDGQAHDCGETPERCVLVAADASDYSLSGGEALRFAPDLPTVDLVARVGPRPETLLLPGSLAPVGPVPAGTTVMVEATGFVPGEPVIVGLCTEAFLHAGVWACDPVDSGSIAALLARSVEGVTLHADAAGAITTEVTVPAVVATFREPDGSVRCAAEPGACAVVVAAAADTQRSSYLPLTVAR